ADTRPARVRPAPAIVGGQRHRAAADGERAPRCVSHGGGPAGDDAAGRPARRARPTEHRADASGSSGQERASGGARPRGRERLRRRRADRSRPHQPAVQRGEAHAQRRRRAHRGASGSGCTGRGPGARRRQRSGDPAGRRATHLRPLLSGARQKAGWQWTGLGLLQARGRAPRRQDHGGERRPARSDRRVHPPGGGPDRGEAGAVAMIRLRRYVGQLFPVRPAERRLTAFLYALLMLMVLSDWVGQFTADSLFVKRLGVGWLPLMFVLTPIAMLVTSAILFAVIDRVRRRALLIGYVIVVMLLAVVIQLALPL